MRGLFLLNWYTFIFVKMLIIFMCFTLKTICQVAIIIIIKNIYYLKINSKNRFFRIELFNTFVERFLTFFQIILYIFPLFISSITN